MYTDPTGHDTEFNKSLNISGKFLKDGYIDVNAILGMDSRNVVSRDKNGNMTGIQVYNVRNSESVFINLKDSSYMEFDSSGRKSGGKLSNAFKTSGKNYYIKTSILEGFSNQKIFADSAEGFMKQVYSLPINDYNALKDNGMTVDGIAELSYRYYAGQKNSSTGSYKSILDYNNKYLANVMKRYMALKKINDVSSLKLSERELRKLVDMNGSWLPDVRYSDISVLFSMFIRSTGHKVVYDEDYIMVDGKKVKTKNGKNTKWDGSQGAARTFTSTDKYVGETANAIEAKYPGKVVDVNKKVYRADGTPLTDYDIELDDAVIQVKQGGGKGATTQAKNTASSTSKEVIVYLPDIKNPNAAVVKGLQKEGFKVFTNQQDLMNYLK